MKLVIRNATIYDPKNGIDGLRGDIYLKGGKISRPFKKADREIDATGLWALPGGIEVGVPLASPGLMLYAHKMALPGPAEISRQYARMGYTHFHESMMFPTTAPAVHHTLSALPYQDTSASICLTLREFGTLIGSDIPPEWTVRFLWSCAQRFRALTVRLPETSAHFKESALARYNIPAQKVLAYLSRLPLSLPLFVELNARLLDEDLPHMSLLHYSHLGRAIDGEYAYKQVSAFISEKGVTGDMGLAPADPHSQLKTEAEIGAGEDVAVHAGMHTPLRYLSVSRNPQSAFVARLATHPDFKGHLAFSSLCLGAEAGKFYPMLFRRLFEADDTYTVGDFVLQTRVLPARLLGLDNKGHLGVGAAGDLALYAPESGTSPGDILGRCHTLVKNGIPVMEKNTFLDSVPYPETRTYYRAHALSERDLAMFAGYFKRYPRLEHLDVPEVLGRWQTVR